MPETAGTAIRINLTSAEFVHFTHMMCLSYVKHNSIPHTHRTYSRQSPRNHQGPKLAHSQLRISHIVYDMVRHTGPMPGPDTGTPHRSWVRSWCPLHPASR